MKLVVVGAAGRMGQTLIRTIHAMPGVRVFAAVERSGSPFIGRDAGEIAGLGPTGVVITDRATRSFRRSRRCAGLHVAVGNRGILGSRRTGPHRSCDRHDRLLGERRGKIQGGRPPCPYRQVRQYEPRGQSARRSDRAGGAGAWRLTAGISRCSKCTTSTRSTRHPGTALLLGNAAAKGRGIDLADAVRACPRWSYGRARRPAPIGFATLRGGSVIGEHSVILAGEGEQVTLSHSATDRSIFARGAVTAALWARDRKPGFYSMLDVLGLS